MKKYIRKRVKDEKRILKLMYIKGILDQLVNDFNHLQWEVLCEGKRQRKRKGKGFAWRDYIPELHLWTVDYWGEGDSHSILESYRDMLSLTDQVYYSPDNGYQPVYSKQLNNKELIEYLKSLPTVKKDSKFNPYLKVVCYE